MPGVPDPSPAQNIVTIMPSTIPASAQREPAESVSPSYPPGKPWMRATPDRFLTTMLVEYPSSASAPTLEAGLFACRPESWISLGPKPKFGAMAVSPRSDDGLVTLVVPVEYESRQYMWRCGLDGSVKDAVEFGEDVSDILRTCMANVGVAFSLVRGRDGSVRVCLASFGAWPRAANAGPGSVVPSIQVPINGRVSGLHITDAQNLEDIWVAGDRLWVRVGDGGTSALRWVSIDELLASSTGGSPTTSTRVPTRGVVLGLQWSGNREEPQYMAISRSERQILRYPIPDEPNGAMSNSAVERLFDGDETGNVEIRVTPDQAVVARINGPFWGDADATPGLHLRLLNSGLSAATPESWFDPLGKTPNDSYVSDGFQVLPFTGTSVGLLRTRQAEGNPWEQLRIGVLDQPPTPFVPFEGDDAIAYGEISLAITGNGSTGQGTRNVRDKYVEFEETWYVNLKSYQQNLSPQHPHSRICRVLVAELANLTTCRQMVNEYKDALQTRAIISQATLAWVTDFLEVKTEVEIEQDGPVSMDIGSAIEGALGIGSGVATAASGLATMAGAAAAASGGLAIAAGVAAVALIGVAIWVSQETKLTAKVTDTDFVLTTNRSSFEQELSTLFSRNMESMDRIVTVAARDPGVAALLRNMHFEAYWNARHLEQLPRTNFEEGFNVDLVAPTAYFRAVATAFFRAFMPFVAARYVIPVPDPGGVLGRKYPDFPIGRNPDGGKAKYLRFPLGDDARYLCYADSAGDTLFGLKFEHGHDPESERSQAWYGWIQQSESSPRIADCLFKTLKISPEQVFFDWPLPWGQTSWMKKRIKVREENHVPRDLREFVLDRWIKFGIPLGFKDHAEP